MGADAKRRSATLPTGVSFLALRRRSGARDSLRHLALLTSREVLVHQTLASGAIEQADGGLPLLGAGGRRLGLLERGAKRGALGAVADRSGARLPHVLLRGCDIRHENSP